MAAVPTLVVALGLALVAAPALAGAQALPAPPEGWEPLGFERVEAATRYEALREGERPVLRAESRCSASGLMLRLEPGQLAKAPRLQWRWRIERALPEHDESRREGDDFAARVYVLFRFDPASASLWERTRHRVASALRGDELPGRAVTYVWSSREPAGRRWASPYTTSARLVSRGHGPLPAWRREEVDPRADYRRLFGDEPPEAVAIALMTDTDDTCGHAVAWFADFRLLPGETGRSGGRNPPGGGSSDPSEG